MICIHDLSDVCIQCHFLTDLMFIIIQRDRSCILLHLGKIKYKEIKDMDRRKP